MALVTVSGRTVRRRQPPRAVGAGRPLSWDVLWAASAAPVNQASGQVVAPVAPVQPGIAGQWVDYQSTSAAQTFAIPSATTYTLVLVLAHPQSSTGSSGRIFANASTGVRVEAYTTGGGVYFMSTHTGVAGGIQFVTGVGGFDTRPWTYVLTYDGTTQRGWLRDPDGSITQASPATIGMATATQADIGYASGASCGIYACGWRRGAVSQEQARDLVSNPWQMFAKRPRRVFVSVGAGGSTYNVSLTEAASVADTVAAIALRVGAMAEAASAADLVASALIATRAVAEAATAAAAATGTMVLPGAVAEAATATDSASTGGVTSNSITEAATASEATASSAALVGAIAETVTAADLAAALKTLQAAISEAATATNLVAGLLVATAAVAEAAAASESASTGPQYAVSLSEAASPADALQAAAQLVGAVTEAATAGAAFSAAASLVGLITEPATASDSASAGATTYSVSLTELAAAVDVLAASLAGDAGMLDNVRTIRGSARDVIRAAARNIIRGYRPS